MKKLFLILFTASILSSCVQCDTKEYSLPYITFYMPKEDTLKFPLNQYTQMRVHKYYKYGKWAPLNFVDSNVLVQTNWRTIKISTDTGSYEAFGFLVDQGITATGFSNDLDKNDFWLKSLDGKLQIKLAELDILYTAPEGRCGDEKWEITHSLIYDSLINKHNEPILLR